MWVDESFQIKSSHKLHKLIADLDGSEATVTQPSIFSHGSATC